MNLNERIKLATKTAEDVLDSQAHRIRVKAREHERPIEDGLMKWARANMNQYVSWLTETNQQNILGHITVLDDVRADMVTIEETTKAFQSKKTALIVLADGKYIVKIRDNVQLYDDVTLPHELRGKLGMLKLVEKGAMVTGIGCRVSDEIFVVLTDGQNEENQTQS
jgi:hypothetical protein